ncbi:E3 ubiquitin-protein ligase TRIM71-like [Saccostrea cucullata]|uniref:E3 ubiquitin-protein ligase TRIM71-like n=1 Tax=Saccostrea cuccullata TaxID=36930 RepID=UPI002ED2CE36
MAGKIPKSLNAASLVCKCDLCLKFHNMNLSWTCLDCEETLCDACKAVHQRGKATKTHKILTTKDFIDAQERGVKIRAGKKRRDGSCDQHEEEAYQFHCNTCYKPICARCVVGAHKLHDFIKLDDFIESGKEKILNDILYLKEETVPLLKENSGICTQKHEESERELTDALITLNDISSKIEKEVSRIKEEIEGELKSVHSQNETNIMNSKSSFDSVAKAVMNGVKKCEDSPKGSFKYIYESNERLENVWALLKTPILPHVVHITFFKGEVDSNALQRMVGMSSKTYEAEVLEMTNMQEGGWGTFSKFKLCQTGISAISLLNDNMAMVREPGTGKGIQRLKIKDGRSHDVTEPINLPHLVTDLCSFNHKVTLVTFEGETYIQMVYSDGKTTTFANLGPLFPIGLCKSPSGEILVTVVESDDRKVTEKSARAVYTLSYSGRVLKKIEFYKGNRIFTWPYKVIENQINGDLLVIDLMESTDRVVCVNREGNEIFSYSGKICPKYPRLLAAQGIAYDKHSNVYISDARNSVIHVISQEGNFLRFVENNFERFYSPWALAVDEKNRLWIGTLNGNIYLVLLDVL